MPVLVFGSVNADLVFAVPELPAPGRTVLGEAYRALPGGKGANQALAAARDRARAALAGAVGRDPLADVALPASRAAGVDLSRVAATDAPTGCAAICVDPAGRNQIALAAGANALARGAGGAAGAPEPCGGAAGRRRMNRGRRDRARSRRGGQLPSGRAASRRYRGAPRK